MKDRLSAVAGATGNPFSVGHCLCSFDCLCCPYCPVCLDLVQFVCVSCSCCTLSDGYYRHGQGQSAGSDCSDDDDGFQWSSSADSFLHSSLAKRSPAGPVSADQSWPTAVLQS